MAISYVGGVTAGRAGSTSTTTQSLSGTLTGGTDTSPIAGDLVVVLCAAGADTTAAPSQDISGNNSGAYTGLTAQSSVVATTYDSYHRVSYKIQGATVDTSLTIPSSGSIRNAQRWVVHVFRGVKASSPLDATSTYAVGTGTGRPNPAAITPATAGAWILAFYASSAGTGTAFTAPTDFATDWLGGTTADSADCMAGGGYYTGWSSGSYDPAAITAGGTANAADTWTATTMALRPELTATVALTDPTAGETVASSTPALTFTGTELNGDTIEFQLQVYNVFRFSDTFTGTNGTELEAYNNEWHFATSYYASGYRVGYLNGSNAVTANANASVYYTEIKPVSTNIFVQATLDMHEPNFITLTNGSQEGYSMQYRGGRLYIRKHWNGGDTDLTSIAYAGTGYHIWRLEWNDGTLTIYIDGSQQLQTSNADYTPIGRAYVWWWASGLLSAFSAGDVATQSTIINSLSTAALGDFEAGHPWDSAEEVTYTISGNGGNGVNTYYFDGSDAAAVDSNNVWTDETNSDDGSTSTYAYTSTSGNATSNRIKIEGTDAVSGAASITSVRARVFGGSDLNAGAWSSYVILSIPSGGWTWAKVQALETNIWWLNDLGNDFLEANITTDGAAQTLGECSLDLNDSSTQLRVYRVEIEVTGGTDQTLSAGTYYWRVRGIDSGSGTWGAWSTGAGSGYESFVVAAGNPTISVSDTTTPTDSAVVQIPKHYISVTDTTTPTDLVRLQIPKLNISVSDTSTPTDIRTVVIPKLYISVSDASAPTDNVTIQIPKNYINVTDTTTPSDLLIEQLPANNITVIDTTAPVDSIVSSISTPSYSTISTLIDNFNDNSIDTVKWSSWGGNVAEINEKLEITSQTTSSWSGITSQDYYDLTGNTAYIQLVDGGNQTIVSYEIKFNLWQTTSSTNALFWYINQGTILAFKTVGSTQTQLNSDTYNYTIFKWLRIREASGTVYWDYSTNGVDWTNFASELVSNLFTITGVKAEINSGTWAAEASTTVAKFDNFNVYPYLNIVVTDTTTPSDMLAGQLPANYVAVSDTATPSDSVAITIPKNYITITDTTTPSDTLAGQLPKNYISVIDTTTPTDTSLVQIRANYITVVDSTTPTDSILINLPKLYISVSDTSAPADSLTDYLPANYISVADTTIPGDTVIISIPKNYVSIIDATAPLDSLLVNIPKLYISVVDSTAPADTLAGQLPKLYISVVDSTIPEEMVLSQIPKNYISVSDTTAPSDALAGQLPKLYIAVTDSTTPTDSLIIFIPKLNIDVFDTTTPSDTIGSQIPGLYIDVFDTTTPVDSAIVTVTTIINDINIITTDSSTPNDTTTVNIPKLYISVIDTTTPADTLMGQLPKLYISVNDTTTSTDSAIVSIPKLYVSITDSTTPTDIAFQASQSRYWVGGTGNWNDATNHWAKISGGTPDANYLPNTNTDVFIDSNSGFGSGGTITITIGNNLHNFTSTSGHSFSIANINNSGLYIYGSLTLEAGITFNPQFVTFYGTETGKTITTAGITLNLPWGMAFYSNGEWILQDNLTIIGDGLYINNGTFNANNKDITVPKYYIESYGEGNSWTINMGSGTWTATTSGGAWYINDWDSTLTLNADTSTIKFTDTSANAKEFAGGNKIYNNFWITGNGTGAYRIYNSNTFNDFKIDTPPHNISFSTSTTTTVNTFTVTGTTGNVMTLDTINGTGQFTLSKSSGIVVCDYLNLSNSNATGGATWYAGPHSTNTTNNTGWIFGNANSVSDTTTPSDSAIVTISTAGIDINVSDSTAPSDTLAGQIPKNYILVTDTTTPSDTLSGQLPKNYINVVDTTGVSDGRSIGYNGTDTDITYSAVKYNQGAGFNGTTSKINLGNNLNFERTDSFSIVMWINNTSTAAQEIFAKNTDSMGHTGKGWAIFFAAYRPYLQLNGGTSYNVSELQAWSDSTSFSGLHHLVITYNGNSALTGVTFYRDGTATGKGSDANNLSTSILNSVDSLLGTQGDGNYDFAGNLDEVAVFNRVLTSGEVSTLYANELVNTSLISDASLLTYYQLEGNSNAYSINNVTVSIPKNYISVTDSTTPADNVGEYIPANYINVVDAAAPADNINLYIGAGGIYITEATAPSEVVAVTIPQNYISVIDTTTPSDTLFEVTNLLIQNQRNLQNITGWLSGTQYAFASFSGDQEITLKGNFTAYTMLGFYVAAQHAGGGSEYRVDIYSGSTYRLLENSTTSWNPELHHIEGTVDLSGTSNEFTFRKQGNSIYFLKNGAVVNSYAFTNNYNVDTCYIQYSGTLEAAWVQKLSTTTVDETRPTDSALVQLPKNYISITDIAVPSDILGQALVKNYITVSDTTAPSDSIKVQIPKLYISVSDTSAPSDTLSGQLPTNNIKVTDSSAPVDSILVQIPKLYISVSDATTPYDTLVGQLPKLNISVIDATIPSETVALSVPTTGATIAVADASTPSDSVNVQIPTNYIATTDGLSATDSVIAIIPSDNINITDTTNPSDSVAVQATEPTRLITVSEQTSATDIVDVKIPQLSASVVDATQPNDIIFTALHNYVNILESAGAGDSLSTYLNPLDINVTDSTAPADTLFEAAGLTIRASDTTSAGDLDDITHDKMRDIRILDGIQGPYRFIFVEGRLAMQIVGNQYIFI